MEDLKKNHPSLPSNYVTIVDLQQRRLKQQQQQQQEDKKEEKEKQVQTQNHLKEQEPHQRVDPPPAVVRTYGTAHRNHRAKRYEPKDRNHSGGTRDQSSDLNNKGKESEKAKQKTVKGNPNLEEEEKKKEIGTTSQQGTELGVERVNKEKKKMKGKKNDDETVEEVEQKFGGLSMNNGNGKKSWGFKRGNGGFRHYRSQRNDFRQFRRNNDEEEKQSGNKMVWVRKDSNVGGEN